MLCPKCKKDSNKIVRGYCNSCYTVMLRCGIIKAKSKVPNYLTEMQAEILNGLMLGDGCIRNGGKNGKLCRLTITRKNTDKGYLDWQFENFRDFYLSPPKEYNTLDKRTNRIYYSCYLNSRVSKVFSNYRSKWYINNQKVVPKDLRLTSLSIAVWFCDDGGIFYNKKGKSRLSVKFATNGFSKNDTIFLANLLSNRYSEYFGVYKNGTGFIIKAAHNACVKIISDIENIIPESMNRKKTWKKD